MKLSGIITSLKERGLDGWSILFQEQERSSLHLTKGERIETSITSRRSQADVTIYQRYGEQLGDARFTLFTDDPGEITRKVEDALLICATAKKPAWPLPSKQAYHAVETADQAIVDAFTEGSSEQLLLRLWKRMATAAKKERSAWITHAELHLTRTRSRVANSEGLSGRSESTSLFAEAIMTAKKGKEESEFHHALTYGRAADFKPAAFIKETASHARDALAAKKWRKVQEGSILLSGTALRDFWAPDLTLSPAVGHANAQLKHRELSRYEQGARITTNKEFTLHSNPFLPHNPSSGKFDNEGTASKRIALITQGVCTGFIASQRFAHYLGIAPTGALGAIQLSPGKERAATLVDDGTVEIVSFSSFVPNSLSGDFSAEIRLGYQQRGGVRVPIKGAMFTGNLFRMLDAMRLSKEETELDRYQGPRLVRFDDGCHLAGF